MCTLQLTKNSYLKETHYGWGREKTGAQSQQSVDCSGSARTRKTRYKKVNEEASQAFPESEKPVRIPKISHKTATHEKRGVRKWKKKKDAKGQTFFGRIKIEMEKIPILLLGVKPRG